MFKYICFFTLFFCCSSCIQPVLEEPLEQSPTVMAVVYTDSLNFIGFSGGDKAIWGASYVTDHVYPFRAAEWANFGYDEREYLQNLFNPTSFSSGGEYNSIFIADSVPSLIPGDTLGLRVEKGGKRAFVRSVVQPSITIQSFSYKNGVLKINAHFSQGTYGFSFRLREYRNTLHSIVYQHTTEPYNQTVFHGLHSSSTDTDSTLTISQGDVTNGDWVQFANDTQAFVLFAETYSIDYAKILDLMPGRSSRGEPDRLYDFLADDVSKYTNLPCNVLPFNGFFEIINRTYAVKEVR